MHTEKKTEEDKKRWTLKRYFYVVAKGCLHLRATNDNNDADENDCYKNDIYFRTEEKLSFKKMLYERRERSIVIITIIITIIIIIAIITVIVVVHPTMMSHHHTTHVTTGGHLILNILSWEEQEGKHKEKISSSFPFI